MTPFVMTSSLAHNFNLETTDFISLLRISSTAPQKSLMHDLAQEGDVLSAEVIFDAGNGNDIDLPDGLGRRPLHEAASNGHIDMVSFLLENGAELEAPVQPLGHTALYLAVEKSRHETVQYLLKRGARLDVKDTLMETGLLHIAAVKGDIKMAGILISAGIDIFAADKRGMTARDCAARHGHRPLAQVLLKVMEHRAKFTV